MQNEYKAYRNSLTNLIRIRKKQFYDEFINKHKKNAKAMWSML